MFLCTLVTSVRTVYNQTDGGDWIMMKKTIIAGMLVLLLAGCDSDDDDSDKLTGEAGSENVADDDSSDDDAGGDTTDDDISGDDTASDDTVDDSGDGDVGSDTAQAMIEGRWSAAYLAPYEQPPVMDVSPRGVFRLIAAEGAVDESGEELYFEGIGKLDGWPAITATTTVNVDPTYDTPDKLQYYETITISGMMDSVPSSLRFSSSYLFDDVDFVFSMKVDGDSTLKTVDELRASDVALQQTEYAIDSMEFNDDGMLVIDLEALSGNAEAPYTQDCTVTASVEPFKAAIGGMTDRHYFDVVQESTSCTDMLPLYGFIEWNSVDGVASLQTNHDDSAWW